MKKGIVLLALLLTACTNPTETTETEAPIEAVTEAVTEAETEEVTEVDVSAEHLHALEIAQKLVDTIHMGKARLFLFLTSDTADYQFPEEIALYAIEHVDVDWMENAVKMAEWQRDALGNTGQYLYNELVQYELLTEEEAAYAMDAIGESYE